MPDALHLHTYFLFPFSVDREAVLADQGGIWAAHTHWFDGFDEWVSSEGGGPATVRRSLGPWRPAPYSQFDVESEAYQDMVFFHPIVRRVFFHTTIGDGREALVRCYTIPLDGRGLQMDARDARGRSAEVDVTDLRLFLFANGIGILSVGVEATRVPMADALWINEMLRKVYPSSGRQVREGRCPNLMRLTMTEGDRKRVLIQEDYAVCAVKGFQPPLSRVITSLLYFADYEQQEYEPLLDERMIVYTYVALDPGSLPAGFVESRDYRVLLSRLIWVDRAGPDYRYDSEFVEAELRNRLYRRWAHQGTWYGFTSYSNVTAAIGTFDCDEHVLREGFLIHRMFQSRYYLMALISLFYRAALLDFLERNALVAKVLYRDQVNGRYTREGIRKANALRSEFLHFANYWYFEEVANKDEEIEHFTMQCDAYRLGPMKAEIEEEIEKLNASLQEFHQKRATEAVNRMAVVTVILGAGALVTGFFGMNFGGLFSQVFFEGRPATQIHWVSIVTVSLIVLAALAFAVFLILANWSDYRDILIPGRDRSKRAAPSLKRGS